MVEWLANNIMWCDIVGLVSLLIGEKLGYVKMAWNILTVELQEVVIC